MGWLTGPGRAISPVAEIAGDIATHAKVLGPITCCAASEVVSGIDGACINTDRLLVGTKLVLPSPAAADDYGCACWSVVVPHRGAAMIASITEAGRHTF